jgi:hypothetical protein
MPQHFDLILKNGTCVLPWGEARADIGLRAGKIAAMGDLRLASATQSIDCAHLHVLPGMIDAHVHLRDPGDASVETLESGTRAPCVTSPPTVAVLLIGRVTLTRTCGELPSGIWAAFTRTLLISLAVMLEVL